MRAPRRTTEALVTQRRERRQAQIQLRREVRKESKRRGVPVPSTRAIPNRRCGYASVEEERQARQETTLDHLAVLRGKLPWLLQRLARIPDPRCPKKTKHQLTVVLLYGLLTFVLRKASRREANQELSRPMFRENLRLLFPELATLPHHDTLNRVLSELEVEEIGRTHRELVERLLRQKTFRRHRIGGRYPVTIDGTGKLVRGEPLSTEWHERRLPGETGQTQHSVYVVEASLAFANGMTIPLMSEFLDNAEDAGGGDKQDCELRAFDRMAKRLKEAFPKLPILLLLDGLYANGPVMDACRRNGWQFLIVLQDGSLPGTWDEYRGLGRLEKENVKTHYWGGRRQHFRWVNGIEREYEDPGNRRRTRRQVVHVVVCEESWEEIVPGSTERVTKRSKHAWLSSEPLDWGTVHERCNLGGRHRWGIEEGFLVEKHHGYQYVRLAHALNVIALYTTALARRVRELGVRGVLRLAYETLTGPWFDPEVVGARWHQGPLQLRLE